MNVVPLFKSHYSIGRSILTLEDPDDSANRPKSMIDIALKAGLDKLFLVDENMSGFLQAHKGCQKHGLQLNFGLRLTVCPDISIKDSESLQKSCKYIVFSKNVWGYKRLIKIFSEAAKDGFYYEPRVDFALLKRNWDEKDLMLAVPFYDSFLHNNITSYSMCVPDFSFARPTFFVEDSNLPFDTLIKNRLDEYCSGKYETVKARSVYYSQRSDFKTYLTFRCINKRTLLSKPNIEHMSSNSFCLEAWKEQNDAK